jgi:sec-independent protein translocase protein TatA
MFGNIRGGEILILLLIVLLLFGARRLPDLAKGLGQSLRVFKKEVTTAGEDDAEPTPAAEPTPPAEPKSTDS